MSDHSEEQYLMEQYPRDMIGYGAQPPQADWPGAARVALQFVVNYEEGAESNVLHGDIKPEPGGPIPCDG